MCAFDGPKMLQTFLKLFLPLLLQLSSLNILLLQKEQEGGIFLKTRRKCINFSSPPSSSFLKSHSPGCERHLWHTHSILSFLGLPCFLLLFWNKNKITAILTLLCATATDDDGSDGDETPLFSKAFRSAQ